jgi:predicted metal-dependent hydrolase
MVKARATPVKKQAERPTEIGCLVVDGRELPYSIHWSSRRRSYGFSVDREGALRFSAPRWVRVAELLDFAQRRRRFIEKRLAELEARKARAEEAALLAGRWCEFPEIWYKRASRVILAPRVRHWAKVVGVTVEKVRINGGRTVWGSCNSLGDINLSWRLLMVPEDLREYVIVHEVCHRRHMNHSKRFWALVGKYVPDYVEKRRALAKFGVAVG